MEGDYYPEHRPDVPLTRDDLDAREAIVFDRITQLLVAGSGAEDARVAGLAEALGAVLDVSVADVLAAAAEEAAAPAIDASSIGAYTPYVQGVPRAA